MKFFLGIVVGVAASRSVHLRRHTAEVGTEAGAVWIPMTLASGEVIYFNPAQGRSVWTPPHGAVLVATATSAKLSHVVGIHDDPDNATAAGNATNGTEHKPAPTIVPLEHRKSCVPHCTWSCSTPACEQECKPDCKVPVCQTRCPKLEPNSFDGCQAKCTEPACAMFCPKDTCNGTKVLSCATPKCATHCEQPRCHLDCGHSLGCKSWCPEPECKWHCRRPKTCPLPKCKMVCEQAPECIQNQVSVPMPPGYQYMGGALAAARDLDWTKSPWSSCSNRCGKGYRHRRVQCNSGNDEDCHTVGPKPRSREECMDYDGCEWQTSKWSKCSERCGEGTRTRSVVCAGPDEDTCHGSKPVTRETCEGQDSTCDACSVQVFGSDKLKSGTWSLQFGPGEYSAAELEYRGAKCDDISSVEVVGFRCEMIVYEFGDFNQEHSGFEATLDEGEYTAADLERRGAKNNDISSFRVIKRPKSTTTTTTTVDIVQQVVQPVLDKSAASVATLATVAIAVAASFQL
mmetsp:Transcript_39186/g.94168  ORF Transcript_39186/g.94168 Transcript_39186/m.94168 type:complete len:514 (+) Transcript_39186:112-1653(+)